MNRITLETIKNFCSKDETRPSITEPWIEDGKLYATDGRIMIRCVEHFRFERNPLIKYPPVGQKVFTQHALAQINAKLWIAAPVVKPDDYMEECVTCGGDGLHECSCGHEHQCYVCEGSGKYPNIEKNLEIGAARFALHYLAKLNSLPTCEVYPTTGKTETLHFRFNGGEGMLMPLKAE